MRIFLENEAKALLNRYGVPVTEPEVVHTVDDARAKVRQLNCAVALKAASRQIIHKARAGCVALGVTLDTLDEAFARVVRNAQAVDGADIEGILLEPMVGQGVEVIVGATHHPGLGPLVMFGLGGTNVERSADVSFSLAPLNHRKILRLLDSQGFSAQKHERVHQALYEVLRNVGGEDGLFFKERVVEMDINPIVVLDDAIIAVDAHVAVEDDPSRASGAYPMDGERLHQSFKAVQALFNPYGVIVVGASTNPRKLGFKTVRSLVDYNFPGAVYCVHPSASEIYGCRAFPSIDGIPERCDRATVIVRAGIVASTLRELAGKGVKVAQVVSAGFREWDDSGRALEDALMDVVRDTGIRVVGPNTVGMFSATGKFSLTARRFSPDEPGTIGFISQSGTFTLDAVQRSKVIGLPLDMALSSGNCLDLKMADYLWYLSECPHIKTIGMYIESEDDSGTFFRVLENVAKPVVLLKGGVSTAGVQAALSHTGALSSDPGLWRDIARQSGAILVENMDDLLDVFTLFAAADKKPIGRRAALFTSGGGVSVSAADAAEKHGVLLEALARPTVESLGKYLTPGTAIKNPIDIPVWGLKDGEDYVFDRMLGLLDADKTVDTIMLCVEMGSIFSYTEDDDAGIAELDKIVTSISRFATRKPLILILRSTGDKTQEDYVRRWRKSLLGNGIAVFPNEYRAIRALGHAASRV